MKMIIRGLVIVACGACSDGQTAPVDAGADADASDGAAAVYPAPHPAMAQAVKGNSDVIASPKLVAITFQGDPFQADIDTFASQLVSAPDYWSNAVAEYGVGALTALAYHSSDVPPATLTNADVGAWLASTAQNDTSFPQPDASTVYMVFYPSGTTIMLGTQASCTGFGGYHDSYPLSSTANIVYAVVARCKAPDATVTDIEMVTGIASHEATEAVTNPLPGSAPAYGNADWEHLAWPLTAGGGEIADLCAPMGRDVFYQAAGLDHRVNHAWSNVAAAASHDPCRRSNLVPYFNAAPVVTDIITTKLGKTKGVRLAAGASATIELDLFSDAPTAAWQVSAVDLASTMFNQAPALTFTLDRATGQNGDKINLTITSLRNVSGGTPFMIQNDLGAERSVWISAVAPN